MEGSKALEFVLEGELDGVLGVKRPVKSLSKARREGVFGNGTEFVTIGLPLDADILFGDGERPRGASMFGRADPFVGDLDNDALGAFTGDVGEGGVDKVFIEDEALGEVDARSWVSLEGLLGTINCGRSAMGMFGI